MSGFDCDYAADRITMVLRADPWALVSMDELRQLAQQHDLVDVPASCLRRELKAAGIKVASLRGDYDSIRVKVAEADLKAAKVICNKYEAGSFDGMTDCYEYSPSAWGSVFGDVRYVFEEVDR